MAATKLRIFQDALRLLADARLNLITDDVESQYALSDAWDGAVHFVLRQAPWLFALETTTLASGGSAVTGYSRSYLFPSGWLRTHAVFLLGAGNRECPVDFREFGTASLSVNAAGAVSMRFVSGAFADPELPDNPWPEHFSQCVAAYLAFSVADRVTGDPGAASRMSELFSSLLPEAVALDAIAEDPWLRHQRSGAFLRVARTMIDEGFWRFAMPAPVAVNTVLGGGGGYLRQAAVPDDWTRTHALYTINAAGQKRPIDVRERGRLWLTNATSFYAEYVSQTLAMDSTQWPDHYMRAVLRQLQFDTATQQDSGNGQPSYGRDYPQRADTAAQEAMQATLDSEADPPDPWLPHQLSGALARCIPAVMSKGYWKFALKSLQYSAETDQDAAPADGGYPYRIAMPADWFKTHAIFVPWDGGECPIDVREHEGHWSTATTAFMVRYVSTAALDPAAWPDSVAKAVLAYLDLETAAGAEREAAAAIWQAALDAARGEWSQTEHAWLRFQLDGRYFEAIKFVLGAARWRFAIKTVTLTADATMAADGTVSGTPIETGLGTGAISPSYSAVFTKPADWYRTIWLYYVRTVPVQVNGGYVERCDIDYRDEGGAWHTNYDTIQVRYLSRDGLDSTRAPASFRNAVLTWLQHEEARGDPKLSAAAKLKLDLFNDLLRRAEEEDDSRERPPVNQVGRFVRGRMGNRSWQVEEFASVGVAVTPTVLTDDSGTTILTP